MTPPQKTILNPEPVEISDNTWWVGRRTDSLLERNIYLRRYKSGGSLVNLLIDPGPPEDLGYLIEKLKHLVGGVQNINLLFINHQDPDVAANSAYLQKTNQNLYILTSEDTWRLIQFYGLEKKNYRFVEQFKDSRVTLSTGHEISFVPSPFCHFRGATMLYDHETGILFTGDLFGGLSFEADLFATKENWEGMKTFHQIYMPSQEALQFTLQNIRSLERQPVMLAPQHGSIITGDLVPYYMKLMSELPVGLDLFRQKGNTDVYVAAMNDILREMHELGESDVVNEVLSLYHSDGSFPNVLAVTAGQITAIKTDPQQSLEGCCNELLSRLDDARRVPAELAIMKVLLGFNLSIPSCFQKTEVAPPPQFFEM